MLVISAQVLLPPFPLAPPRLEAGRARGLRCAGLVEFYMGVANIGIEPSG